MSTEELRQDVRRFLSGYNFESRISSWLCWFSPEFSARVGDNGWIGMTWPEEHGGGSRTAGERYAVLEELLAAGAQVAAHWFSDRQTGPQILRFGSAQQRSRYLPDMARGRLFSCVGMSEPDAGSDLSAIHTRATFARGGWRVSGAKTWTSHAHHAHVMLALVRTGEAGYPREDFSQFLIPFNAAGVTVRPIRNAAGADHFNEVFLDDVELPRAALFGASLPGADDGCSVVPDVAGRCRYGRFAKTVVVNGRSVTNFTPVSELVDWAGEPTDVVSVTGGDAASIPVGALVRSVQILGALDCALELCVGDVRTRVQFEKPIATFQSVRALLADVSTEHAIVESAVLGAIDQPTWRSVGVAKTCAGGAGSRACAAAHQIHGAIGTTEECSLVWFTRRILTWRDDFGDENFWAERLGASAFEARDSLWAWLTSVRAGDTPLGATAPTQNRSTRDGSRLATSRQSRQRGVEAR